MERNSNQKDIESIIKFAKDLRKSLKDYTEDSQEKLDQVFDDKGPKIKHSESIVGIGFKELKKKVSTLFEEKGISINTDLTRKKMQIASKLIGDIDEGIYELFPNGKNANDCATVLTLYLLNAKQQNNQAVLDSGKVQGKFGGSGGKLAELIDKALDYLETLYNSAYKEGLDTFQRELTPGRGKQEGV